jgi:hypothetical protein
MIHSHHHRVQYWPAVVLAVVTLNNSGCTHKPIVEGYRVMSFDSTTGQWVILRNGTFDGKYLTKRMTVVCEFYKWGNRERVNGPNACSLRVGSLMVPRYLLDDKKNVETVLYMFEDSDYLSTVEGTGDDQVMQGFKILKNEVVPE